MEKKRILITGGAGFIGSHVVRHFVNKYPDYLIVNFDALTYAGNLENLKDIEHEGNYSFVKGDIRNVSDVNAVFKNYAITDVIHLAAESHVDRSMVNPTVFAETNVMGTLNLLNIARELWKEDYSSHRFFNMATDEIFGALGADDEPFNENTPLDPHSPYSTSKTAQYLFGSTYYEAYGLPVISLSCGNAIGPNQFPEKLVPLTIDRIFNEEEIPIYGKGEQMRDWTNVHDIADAIDLLFHEGTVGELYCIGGDACKKNIQIVHAIIDEIASELGAVDYTYSVLSSALEKPDTAQICRPMIQMIQERQKKYNNLIKFIPDPRGKSHDFRYDINHDKITEELGWEPKYTFEQSIRQTVKWYLDNHDWVKNVKSGEYKKWIDTYYGK